MKKNQTDASALNPEIETSQVRQLVLLALCDAYLSAGLPPQHALRSAQADYVCYFEKELPCAA